MNSETAALRAELEQARKDIKALVDALNDSTYILGAQNEDWMDSQIRDNRAVLEKHASLTPKPTLRR